MSELTNLIWALFALGVLGLVVAGVVWAMRTEAATAGEQTEDEREAIDETTTQEIEDAPTKPDADYANDVGDSLRDTAEDLGTDTGDGFQPKRPEDDSGDLLPVEWPDS